MVENHQAYGRKRRLALFDTNTWDIGVLGILVRWDPQRLGMFIASLDNWTHGNLREKIIEGGG